MTATLKDFLEACETLGTLRLIVTNEVAVLEARGTIQKLFYAELPKDKYKCIELYGQGVPARAEI